MKNVCDKELVCDIVCSCDTTLEHHNFQIYEYIKHSHNVYKLESNPFTAKHNLALPKNSKGVSTVRLSSDRETVLKVLRSFKGSLEFD